MRLNEFDATPRLRVTILAASLTAVVAGVVASRNIATPQIWRDEAVTIVASTRTWPRLGEVVLGELDAVHALYYAAMKVWLGLVGVSELTLRLPSVAAFAVAAGLLVVLGVALGSLRVGVLAGIVLLCLPRANWTAVEGRSYAFALMLSVAIVLFGVLAATRSRRWWWGYGAALLLGAHVFLFLMLLAPVVAAFVWARRSLRSDWTGYGLATAGAAVGTIPLAIVAAGQRGQISWIAPVGPQTLREVLLVEWVWWVSAWIGAVWWVLTAAGLAVVAWRPRPAPGRRAILVLLAAWLVVPTAVLIVASAVWTPVFDYRYGVVSLAAMALAGGFAIDALPAWWLRVFALVALAAVSIGPFNLVREEAAKAPLWDGSVLAWTADEAGDRGFTDGEWAWVGGASIDGGVSSLLNGVSPADAVVAIGGADAVAPYAGPVVIVAPSDLRDSVAEAKDLLAADGEAQPWPGLLPLAEVPAVLDGAARVWVVSGDSFASSSLDADLRGLGFTAEEVAAGRRGEVTLYARP